MTDWKTRDEREKALAAQLRALFREIATLMPDWTIKATDPADGETWRNYVLERDGMGIHFRRDSSGKGDRVTIGTWEWPSYTYMERGSDRKEVVTPHHLYDPKESSPSITCAMDRGAAAIVKGINRRFLPDYELIYGRCMVRAQEAQAYHNKARDSWQAICAVIGGNPDHGRHYYGPLTIEKRSDGAKVEVNMSADKLKQLITVMGYVKER